jgi:hypothetical protein
MMTRLMGLIVLSMGVQFALTGYHAFMTWYAFKMMLPCSVDLSADSTHSRRKLLFFQMNGDSRT